MNENKNGNVKNWNSIAIEIQRKWREEKGFETD